MLLKAYSGNVREQDLRAYEGKQLRMYQETPFLTFFHIHVCEITEHIICLQSMILLFLLGKINYN